MVYTLEAISTRDNPLGTRDMELIVPISSGREL